MKIIPNIKVRYDQNEKTAIECEGALYVEAVTEKAGMDFLEYHGRVTNVSDRIVRLERASLFETDDLSLCGIGEGPYDVYRSGRHKNDMPGVFTLGCKDDRMADVSSVMAESGDGLGDVHGGQVVSDHFTILKGSCRRCFAAEFVTGRDQLFQTRILLDEQGNFLQFVSEVIFQIELLPGESVTTETIRLAVTNHIEEEIEQFAEWKAKIYGTRNQRHPAVFCTWYGT